MKTAVQEAVNWCRRIAGPELQRWGREQALECCRQLEEGRIVLLESMPFSLPAEAIEFLLSHRQSTSRYHKNISYRPMNDRLKGAHSASRSETLRLRRIMGDYSRAASDFLGRLLSPYASTWALDFASFRPIEEEGRPLSLHKRNDLLHVDAFPSRPTRGSRILRIFSNINPQKPRLWNVAGPFDAVARKYANAAGLERIAQSAGRRPGRFNRSMRAMATQVGWPGAGRSPYDEFMLAFHDFLKESADFQNNFGKTRIEFPAGSTWIVLTDCVAHAVLSGQFALEQTFIVPAQALAVPDKAPISILESLCNTRLA